MTQQEIQANRTQGEWIYDCGSITDSNGMQIADFVARESNAAAIVSAVNGTYGKGVNPEAVDIIIEALQAIKHMSDDTSLNPKMIRIWETASKALNAAKL